MGAISERNGTNILVTQKIIHPVEDDGVTALQLPWIASSFCTSHREIFRESTSAQLKSDRLCNRR